MAKYRIYTNTLLIREGCGNQDALDENKYEIQAEETVIEEWPQEQGAPAETELTTGDGVPVEMVAVEEMTEAVAVTEEHEGWGKVVARGRDVGDVLRALHRRIDGHRGKEVALVFVAAHHDGLLRRLPTYAEACREFGDIGSRSNFYVQLNKRYTQEELGGYRIEN